MPYRVTVRGAEVVADSLDDLDALLERYVGPRQPLVPTAASRREGVPSGEDPLLKDAGVLGPTAPFEGD